MGPDEILRRLLRKEKEIKRTVSCTGQYLDTTLRWLVYYLGEAEVKPEDKVKITFHLVRKH